MNQSEKDGLNLTHLDFYFMHVDMVENNALLKEICMVKSKFLEHSKMMYNSFNLVLLGGTSKRKS